MRYDAADDQRHDPEHKSSRSTPSGRRRGGKNAPSAPDDRSDDDGPETHVISVDPFLAGTFRSRVYPVHNALIVQARGALCGAPLAPRFECWAAQPQPVDVPQSRHV